ncbi:MAG: glutaredoxin family protein [Leptolyngbyaceae cyanobacterium bins.59]|nr:glutaredoxin family protein [Leptolyngbyaceae cyanobacterium bins.59]
MHLILYSKPGCHLCEGLQTKLEQIQELDLHLEVRDITTQEEWQAAYEFEIPVLYLEMEGHFRPLPRPSPRATVQQLTQMLQKYTQPGG